jgi:hypothetical protein
MPPIKHIKTRNTGLIFEILLRKILEESSQNKSIALKIIKSNFRKGSELRKDLKLYQTFYSQKVNPELDIKRFVNEIFQYDSVDEEKLKREVYHLCGMIKEAYGDMKEFFKTTVPEYKVLASIYQVLQYSRYGVLNSENIQHKMICENFITDFVKKRIENKDSDLKFHKFQRKLFVERYRDKYSNLLTENQKLILNSYLGRDITKLKVIANNYISELSREYKVDENTQNRLNECKTKVMRCNFSNEQLFENMKILLYTTELLNELKDLRK